MTDGDALATALEELLPELRSGEGNDFCRDDGSTKIYVTWGALRRARSALSAWNTRTPSTGTTERAAALEEAARVELVARAMVRASRPNADPDKLVPKPRGQMGTMPLWRTCEHLALAAIRALLAAPAAGGGWQEIARPLDEWHEDMGDVTWWMFPVQEAAWIGSPLADNWPGYHTHFTPLPKVPTPPLARQEDA